MPTILLLLLAIACGPREYAPSELHRSFSDVQDQKVKVTGRVVYATRLDMLRSGYAIYFTDEDGESIVVAYVSGREREWFEVTYRGSVVCTVAIKEDYVYCYTDEVADQVR